MSTREDPFLGHVLSHPPAQPQPQQQQQQDPTAASVIISSETASASSLGALLNPNYVGPCPSLENTSQSPPEPAEPLPPTYATLPKTTKLEEEPNPFEQSFGGEDERPVAVTRRAKPALTKSTAAINPQRVMQPNPIKFEPEFIHHTYENHPKPVNRARTPPRRASSQPDEKRSQKRRSSARKYADDEEKRKNFLERNRQAALKCRQRKKQWLQDMQSQLEYLTADNEQLQQQTTALREELIHMKTILLSHKSCPINQQAILDAINRPIPGVPSSIQQQSNNQNMPDTRPQQPNW
ncbi:hypothetical protein BCR43DRAFT_495664 [Syncephalastrum racemosum]|uniref:BZIP domain-containing protein n=1 Tax=Syncephalastrum racemosum TaxID=13706 RepID=A0A1X2H7H9_SYNRA|nr:hypothetical protein BCR43DRAFT_495664 [Syncephalastrum racemosum]